MLWSGDHRGLGQPPHGNHPNCPLNMWPCPYTCRHPYCASATKLNSRNKGTYPKWKDVVFQLRWTIAMSYVAFQIQCVVFRLHSLVQVTVVKVHITSTFRNFFVDCSVHRATENKLTKLECRPTTCRVWQCDRSWDQAKLVDYNEPTINRQLISYTIMTMIAESLTCEQSYL